MKYKVWTLFFLLNIEIPKRFGQVGLAVRLALGFAQKESSHLTNLVESGWMVGSDPVFAMTENPTLHVLFSGKGNSQFLG